MKTGRRQVKLLSVSHKTELEGWHNSWVILMTMLSCKLKNCIILLQFVILLNVLQIKKLQPYTTGRLEDSGGQNDEKMSRNFVNAQSRPTFFRYSAVLSLPTAGILLHDVNDKSSTSNANKRHNTQLSKYI